MNIQEGFRRVTVGISVLWSLWCILQLLDYRFSGHRVITYPIFVDLLLLVIIIAVGIIIIWLIYFALSWIVKGFLAGGKK